jgi:hypothetical protein
MTHEGLAQLSSMSSTCHRGTVQSGVAGQAAGFAPLRADKRERDGFERRGVTRKDAKLKR